MLMWSKLNDVDWCGARLVCKDKPRQCNASESWSDPQAAEGLQVGDVYSAGTGGKLILHVCRAWAGVTDFITLLKRACHTCNLKWIKCLLQEFSIYSDYSWSHVTELCKVDPQWGWGTLCHSTSPSRLRDILLTETDFNTNEDNHVLPPTNADVGIWNNLIAPKNVFKFQALGAALLFGLPGASVLFNLAGWTLVSRGWWERTLRNNSSREGRKQTGQRETWNESVIVYSTGPLSCNWDVLYGNPFLKP